MSSTTSIARQDSFWWQGSLMEIKARADDTGGALGVLEGTFYQEGYGPPLHVHTREDEVMYVLEGQIRFGVGDDEFVAGPAHGSGSHGAYRTPSKSSPRARVRS